MARLPSKCLEILKRKLTLFIGEEISVQNDSDCEVEFEVDEVPDGSRPKLKIRIIKFLQREK